MINRANLQLGIDRSVKSDAAIARELEALKTNQIVGGENLVAKESPQHVFTTVMAPGSYKTLQIAITNPVQREVYISEMRFGFFIDHNADFNYVWPGGPSLSSDQFLFERSMHADTVQSTETSDGTKTYVLSLKNTGSSSKTVYVYYSVIYFEQSGFTLG